MEFTNDSNESQYIVIRNSQIGWAEDKCISMDKLAQEDHSYCPFSEEYERFKKNLYMYHWTNQAQMHRWNSDKTSEQQSH